VLSRKEKKSDQICLRALKRARLELAHTLTSNNSIRITKIRQRRHGSARKKQLHRLVFIHNYGLRIVVGAFCICRMRNLLCEAGMANLSSRRALKAATTSIRIVARLEHPMKQARRRSRNV
jgi:hypothetical protein